MSFKNKVVLVSGSGSGIGEATAILFAKEGANVVIVDCNEETAKNTGEKCKEFGNKVLVVKADISKDEEAKNIIETTVENFGKLDVLINNVGITRPGNLAEGTIMDNYDTVMNTNLRAVVMMTSLATPYLIKSKGCIVNTSSIASVVLNKMSDYPCYCLSKAGVDSFTRIAAIELAAFGVRVNAVSPGPVYTNVFKNCNMPGSMDDFAAVTLLKKCSDPKEIAGVIAFLASDAAGSITGSDYVIDNGMGLA
ncbi:3-oxoacyl-[acyl-carrier-protein] reductase FabG-like [Anticarsia gemmatalis]|uniref:3-oxoacyl-[acyl-carrier-protein] reductase FabG-like n=1 Tax=Anticarsia gemmatalis TaxID=129554 RepID=UPI003F7605E8